MQLPTTNASWARSRYLDQLAMQRGLVGLLEGVGKERGLHQLAKRESESVGLNLPARSNRP